MGWCLRISPLIAAALLGLRARWLLGVFTGSSARAAAPATAGRSVLTSMRVPTSVSEALNLLRGTGSVVSQFFAWLYLVIALCLVLGFLRFVLGELELRREFRRRSGLPAHAELRPPAIHEAAAA